ncbi:MAG: hypothetical protein U0414_05920 [Polyangiaceae bacterium]
MQPRIDDAPKLEERIAKTPLTKVKALVDEVDRAARGPHRAAAELATSEATPKEIAARAEVVLAAAEEFGIAPLIELERVPAASRLFALRSVTAATIALRKRVYGWVEGSLADKEEIPTSESGEAEEPNPRERVCDVAWLELRRQHHLGEDDTSACLDARRLHQTPFEGRDKLMAKLRAEARLRPVRADWDNV